MATQQELIVGITGATGIIYGIELLKALRKLNIKTHLVMSKAADIVWGYEGYISHQEVKKMADYYYHVDNLAAPLASGSYKTMGMIIAPCSMRSLGEIANSITSNLLTRAAEVTLKERRRLLLLTVESPLHAGHLKNMLSVTEMGGIIVPPTVAHYVKPETIEDLTKQTVGRMLDLFHLDTGIPRWTGRDKIS